MLSCSIWFPAPSLWMGGGLENRCVGRVCGADGAETCRAKITLIKLPCCIKLAFQIISFVSVVWTLYISECENGNIKFNGTTRTPRAYFVKFWNGLCMNLRAAVTIQST